MKKIIMLIMILFAFTSFVAADDSITNDSIICSNTGYLICDDFNDTSIDASLWKTTSACTGPTEAGGKVTVTGACRADPWGGMTVFEPLNSSNDWTVEIKFNTFGGGSPQNTAIWLNDVDDYNAASNICLMFGSSNRFNPITQCTGGGLGMVPAVTPGNRTVQYFYNSTDNQMHLFYFANKTFKQTLNQTTSGNLSTPKGIGMSSDNPTTTTDYFYALAWIGAPSAAPYLGPPVGVVNFVPPTPDNGTTDNTQVIINVTCVPDTNNVTLWFGSDADPVVEVLSGVPSPGAFTTNVTVNQEYFYKASCDDGTINSSIRSWTFDNTLPVIVDNFINNSRVFNLNLTGEFNFTDNILLNSVNFSVDGTTIFANTSINSPTFNHFLNFNTRSFSRGSHLLTIRVADAHTARELRADYEVDRGLIFNNELKYTFPDRGYIKSRIKDGSLADEWTSERLRDRYRQRLIPANPASTIILVEESNRPIQIVNARGMFKDQWIIIDDHWKDYVIENEPQSKVSIKRITPYMVEVTISDLNNPEDLQFDSVGDLNIVTKTYNFTAQDVTETFDSAIFLGFSTQFILDIFNPPTPNPLAILNFNGTNFTATVDFSNINQVRYIHTLTVNVSGVNESIQVPHNWFFNLSGPSFDFTDFQNQTLFNVTVDNCSINTFPIINISYIDEEDGTPIVVDNEFQFSFFDGNTFINISGIFKGHTSDAFCTNIDPNISTFNFDMSGSILSLTSPNYATRLFEFPLLNPISTSNNPITNLTLPLILLNSSRSVNYQWITTDFQPINGIMRINKCLAGNQFLLVESVPIIDSGANANIQTLNTPYSYEVIIDGVVFRDEDGFSRCHLEAEDAGSIGTPLRFFVDVRPNTINEEIGLFSAGCSMNKTGPDTVKMTWGLNSQDASTITGCLNAFRSSNLGNTLIFENCTTGGSIERTIPVTGFDYTVSGTLTQNNFSIPCDNSITFIGDSDVLELFGLNAVLGVVLLIMALSLFFAGNGEAQMIGAVIGVVGAWVLGIMAFNWIIVSAIISFILIIVSVGRYGRS